jgi:RNA binding exosome subunit
MAHVQTELVRERQQTLMEYAQSERLARQAQLHKRIIRQAERAERRQLSNRDQAIRLRARLNQIESAL